MARAVRDNKDNLGNRDDTRDIIFVRVEEKVQLEEQSTVTQTETLGNSWIVGSSTNGIVGTNTSTQGGGQQVVGASSRTTTTHNIVNPNNTYRERLTTTNFKDAGNTTATWSGNGQITFTSSQIAQSTSVFNNATISVATLFVDDDTNLTLELSANGGSNWETVTNNTQYFFTNTGSDLRFKFTASGAATLTLIRIKYS